ncbi:alpha/beta-hydrolase [Ascobolus immersus RN42]|uniref:Alpha/beta-hydrolase n=1 Tax=Ascobolus immersus RN42 TaxID=1160509 RepID=A0A3N4IFT6_ASCIM|nr:alpha/beta-hydrolase [Ascobolus immersus RN42]
MQRTRSASRTLAHSLSTVISSPTQPLRPNLPPTMLTEPTNLNHLSGNIQVKELHFKLPFHARTNNTTNGNFSSTDNNETIPIFARAVRTRPKTGASAAWSAPWILYLQGGPGFECSSPSRSSFTAYLLDKGYQVLFMDQRGTGLSGAVSAEDVVEKGDGAVEWLKQYRADGIVRDAEAIRKILLGEDGKWSVLGQSFGGFCAVHYLSYYPNSLKEVFTTGGLPPLTNTPDSIYPPLYSRLASRNEAYYSKYPCDIPRIHKILSYLSSNDIKTPNGGNLTPRRFLALGLEFGGQSGIDSVHNIVLRASTELEHKGRLSRKTLHTIESSHAFDENIFYAILHEAIYAQDGTPTNWSAARKIEDAHPAFQWEQVLARSQSGGEPEKIYFTGEMIYPWMFDDFAELRSIKNVAEQVAKYDGWGKLYDVEQLRRNEVPVYSAIYMEDMYVSYEHALETAKKLGAHKWTIDNVHFHDALRKKTDEVLGGLFKLQEGIVE